MTKASNKDKILSGPPTTESLGVSSSAGLTEGLMGTSPLFPNYDDLTESGRLDKNSMEQDKELT